jgi:hypothetical protein
MYIKYANQQKDKPPTLSAAPYRIFDSLKAGIDPVSKSIIAVLLVAVGLLCITPAMAAKCVSWDLPQEISLQQDNDFLVNIVFNPYPYDAQNSGPAGGATYYTDDDRIDGIVSKLQFDGVHIDFKINWKTNKTTGIYSGTVDNEGARGTTYDKKLGVDSHVGWSISSKFPCVIKEGLTQEQVAANDEYKKQREDEIQVTGKSERECKRSNDSCEARIKTQVGLTASIGVIAKECQPYFLQCIANAGQRSATEAEAKKVRDNETQVTGRTSEQCDGAFNSCRTRLMAQLGKVKGLNASVQQCEPFRQQCLGNAAAAAPKGDDDNGDGGDNGGGQSNATVIKSVDVYDAPGGEGDKIGRLRRGAKISAEGDCPDNWCHVSGSNVPNGDGYVYNGDDYQSLRF